MRFALTLIVAALATIPVGYGQDHIRELMTPAQFKAAGLHKLSPAELRALDRWFAAMCGANAPSYPEPTGDFTGLLGASLIAADGTFLGKISRNTVEHDSISNTISPYGSSLGSTSIFNTLGQYGSTLSSLSPFSSLASSPPRIVKDGRQLGYLTKNSMKQPAIDPDDLLKWLNLQDRR
jgi:hypothetical protein